MGLRLEWKDFGSTLGRGAGRSCTRHEADVRVGVRQLRLQVAQMLPGEMRETVHGRCGGSGPGDVRVCHGTAAVTGQMVQPPFALMTSALSEVPKEVHGF